MEGCCSSTGLSVMSLKGEYTRLVWLVFGRGLGCRSSYEGLRKGIPLVWGICRDI